MTVTEIRSVSSPDSTRTGPRITRAEAMRLAGRIRRVATVQAINEHRLIQLVGELDAAEVLSWFEGVASTAHWLSWECSMSPGTAREHVRVARALREMPRTDALFAEGRLTYSKVREITRLAGRVDEGELCELALMMTASQLARTVRAFRAVDGAQAEAVRRSRVSWRDDGDGTTRISVVLPTEEAAVLRSAVEVAADQDSDEVSAAALADVPAGTSDVASGTCHIEGSGPIEAATAQRLACSGTLVGAIMDTHGDVLALGRKRRLASRAQRRALRIREAGTCQFPGCHRTRWLDAHHAIPWWAGGPTDLDNLVLLCRRHHTAVHEGGIQIDPHRGATGMHWLFRSADGSPVSPPGAHTSDVTIPTPEELTDQEALIPDDATVFPVGGGAGFDLHECVWALFQIRLPDTGTHREPQLG